ncbi:MAG: flagellar biosynthetic protein FliQ [Isosphaeraceae bacterium]|jgi:flagellar biosynthesis protein FliQ
MTIVDLTHVIDWSREALRMSLLLGGPLLAVALLAGLVINVLQTVTQLHEPVVGLVPRLVAVLLVLLAILPWLIGRWVSFTVDLIGSIPDLL